MHFNDTIPFAIITKLCFNLYIGFSGIQLAYNYLIKIIVIISKS